MRAWIGVDFGSVLLKSSPQEQFFNKLGVIIFVLIDYADDQNSAGDRRLHRYCRGFYQHYGLCTVELVTAINSVKYC